jgi:hypothetical protein
MSLGGSPNPEERYGPLPDGQAIASLRTRVRDRGIEGRVPFAHNYRKSWLVTWEPYRPLSCFLKRTPGVAVMPNTWVTNRACEENGLHPLRDYLGGLVTSQPVVPATDARAAGTIGLTH